MNSNEIIRNYIISGSGYCKGKAYLAYLCFLVNVVIVFLMFIKTYSINLKALVVMLEAFVRSVALEILKVDCPAYHELRGIIENHSTNSKGIWDAG